MPLYKQSGRKLIPIKEKKIDLEKTIQNLTEHNLNEIFGLEFISSEFFLNGLRVDTLAFDPETKSFVIIEYKRDRSFSVIDQGYAYLSLLLNNKADFVLEYNEKRKKNLRKNDIDWSQSRIIFIANSFTKYQQQAISFKDLPIELWEVKFYEKGLVSFEKVKVAESSESIKTISKNKNIEKVSKEIKRYSIEDHIKPHWNKAKELFEEFSQKVLELDPRFEIHPVKYYIGFKIEGKVIVEIMVRKSKLIMRLHATRPKDLKDPEGKAKYVKKSFEYFNQHLTDMDIETSEDISYAIFLLKQTYKRLVA